MVNFVMNKIPVLMYHSIQGRCNAGSGCSYETKEEDFESQMRFLAENGYSSILFDDLLSSRKMSAKGIVITFDDGHLSNYTIAFPILLKYGLRAEFFITPDQITDNNRMKPHHLREMIDNGMSIGSHGLTHAYLDDLSDDRAKKELLLSREKLADMLGRPIVAFSAPGGRFYPHHIQMAVNCGYHVFCTSRPGLFDPQTALLDVPRMPVCQGNVQNFTKIIMGDSSFYFKKKVVAVFLGKLKKILGNQRYENFRRFILQE